MTTIEIKDASGKKAGAHRRRDRRETGAHLVFRLRSGLAFAAPTFAADP